MFIVKNEDTKQEEIYSVTNRQIFVNKWMYEWMNEWMNGILSILRKKTQNNYRNLKV